MREALSLVEFQPGDLELMQVRDVVGCLEDLPQRLNALAQNRSVDIGTIIQGRMPIAILGMTPLYQGVFEVWTVTTDLVKMAPVSFHSLVMHSLEHFERAKKAHRLQTAVRADYVTGHRWAESLGFEREGLMKKYGPDQRDFYLYARCR